MMTMVRMVRMMAMMRRMAMLTMMAMMAMITMMTMTTMTADDYEARPVAIDGILVGFGVKLRLTTASMFEYHIFLWIILFHLSCVCNV